MSDSDNRQGFTVKFIKDEPSKTDFFGSHGRIADAVAEVISDDNGINVIGLLGSWGSGKSTVVSQVQTQLKASRADIHFFNYDAWLYQNDPTRRSFLEALIQDLVQNELSANTQWQARLADLSGRSEETVTETSRKLSLTGKWILGSLGLVPIGTVVLGRSLDPNNVTNASWMMWAGISLTLAPVIIAALFYIFWRPWYQSGLFGIFKRGFWNQHRAPYQEQSIFALLTNQSVERTEKKTKISPEPSVTEFRTVFRDVLKSLRAKRERLVIVIDNLDRLSEAEAIDLWSTIRSLFLGSELNGHQKSELCSPSIILPIDESSVQRMFRSHGVDEAKELAQSFMDKTFDISFHINAPVMSDWRAFFKEKLELAFGRNATAARVYWATQFVEDEISVSKITPRSLVKLVNAVGVIVKQWQDGSIDFLSMVFFVLHRSQIAANPSKFVMEDWRHVGIAVADWKRDIVSLYYGVPREKAFQTLLQQPLRRAISSMDEFIFSALAEVAGFGPVFEGVVANLPQSVNSSRVLPDFIANAALLLSASDSREELWAKRSMKELASSWCDCEELGNFRTDFAKIVQVLAPFKANSHFLQVSADQLGASLPKVAISKEVVTSFVNGVIAIDAAAKLRGQEVPLVKLTLDSPALFTLVKHVPATLLPILQTNKSAYELVNNLGISLAHENESSDVPYLTSALASNSTIKFNEIRESNWGDLSTRAFNTISNNALSFHATAPSINVLGILHSKDDAAKAYTTQLFDQNRLTSLLNEAGQEKNASRLGDIAALMFLKGSDFAGPNGMAWDQVVADNLQFVKSFGNALERYTWNNEIEYAHQALKTRPSLSLVVSELIKNDFTGATGAKITTKYLMENISSLEILVGKEFIRTALAAATKRGDILPSLEELTDWQLYKDAVYALLDVDEVDRSKLIESIRSGLASLDTIAWGELILKGGISYELAETYSDTLRQSAGLGDDLKTALTIAQAKMPQFNEDARKRWFYLTRFLSKDTRSTMFKYLRDVIQSGTDITNLAELVQAGSKEFLSEGKFEATADQTTRHLTLPFLQTEIGLACILDHMQFFVRCLAASDKATKNTVKETLNAADDAIEEGGKGALENVKLSFLAILEIPKASTKPRKSKKS
jgi:Cdc6-like AAA superfamily ATPase